MAINPPTSTKAGVSKGPTWPDVVAMYRELGLVVCDDEKAIRVEFDKRRPVYVRDAASPQQDISARARKNMENGQALMTANVRTRYINIVFDAFSANAETSLAGFIQTGGTKVTAELVESLAQLAQKSFSTRQDLASRLVKDWLGAKGIDIGSDPRRDPPQISNFTAAGGVGEIRLSWDRPKQFCDRVVVTRQGESIPVFSGPDDHCVDRQALAGVTHTYEVRAEYNGKLGPKSSPASATALTEVLDPAAKLVNGIIYLTWKLPFKNAFVRIFRRKNQSPLIKRGGVGPEAADSDTRQVYSGSDTDYSEQGVEGTTVYYLITVDDRRGTHTPGASLPVMVPKPPPAPKIANARYRFDSGRDVVEVDWQPDGPMGKFSYVVVRREGSVAPKTPIDGVASPAVRALTWEDKLPGLVSGKCYTYGVFALDDKVYSHSGCPTVPVRILSEVAQCDIHPEGSSLELVWQPPKNVSQVRVRRLPLPGVELAVLGNTRAIDKAVSSGVRYRYVIDCLYGFEGGKELRSPGIEVAAEAGGPPEPVHDFRVLGVGVQIECCWAKPTRGGIRAWKSKKAPALAEAVCMTIAQRDLMLKDCEAIPLRPGHDKAIDTSPDDDHSYYFALAEGGAHCVMGSIRRAGVCPPVSQLEVLESNPNRVVFTWVWPSVTKTAVILYRPDAWPAAPDDPAAIKRPVTEFEFDRNGSRIELLVPGMQTAYFVVLPYRHAGGDEPVYASVDDPACRVGPLEVGQPPQLSYSISESRWLKKYTLTAEMINSWAEFGGVVLVASPHPTDSMADGVRVWEPKSSLTDRVKEDIHLASLKERGWRKCYLRLFLKDNSQSGFVEIIHPAVKAFEL